MGTNVDRYHQAKAAEIANYIAWVLYLMLNLGPVGGRLGYRAVGTLQTWEWRSPDRAVHQHGIGISGSCRAKSYLIEYLKVRVLLYFWFIKVDLISQRGVQFPKRTDVPGPNTVQVAIVV